MRHSKFHAHVLAGNATLYRERHTPIIPHGTSSSMLMVDPCLLLAVKRGGNSAEIGKHIRSTLAHVHMGRHIMYNMHTDIRHVQNAPKGHKFLNSIPLSGGISSIC